MAPITRANEHVDRSREILGSEKLADHGWTGLVESYRPAPAPPAPAPVPRNFSGFYAATTPEAFTQATDELRRFNPDLAQHEEEVLQEVRKFAAVPGMTPGDVVLAACGSVIKKHNLGWSQPVPPQEQPTAPPPPPSAEKTLSDHLAFLHAERQKRSAINR